MFLKFLSDSNNFIYHYSLKIKQHLPYNYLFIIGKKKDMLLFFAYNSNL